MNTTLIAVSQSTAYKVRAHIAGCEHCNPAEAEFPLPWLLDAATGFPGSDTDYVLAESLKCPRCFALIDEETLVEWV